LGGWTQWCREGRTEEPAWLLPFRDARQGELFWALFTPPEGPGVLPRRAGEDAVSAPAGIPLPAEGLGLACGASSDFPAGWRHPRLRHLELPASAPAVARLAREALRRGDPTAPPGLQPRYGREPRAMTQWGAPPAIDREEPLA
ncbi:MAG: hypothetical protein AABZ64_04400, partial [Nitrospinota bacterium]